MATRRDKQVIQVIEQGLDEILAKIKQLNQEKKKASGTPVNVKSSGKSTQSVQNQSKAVQNLGENTRGTSKSVGELGRNMKGTAQITSNQTKAFAKQSQGMGGLVAAYATLAANVFAVSAAFNALQRASEFQKVIEGAQSMSQQLGISVTSMVEDLRTVTDNAVSMEAAFRASAQAATANVGADSFRELAVVAKGAALALGRDVQQSLDRISRGVIKLEPELLDEIGIMVRLDDAVSAYAKQVGKAASDVTFLEKRQAFMNAVIDQGTRKFAELAEGVEASEFSQLAAKFQDLSRGVLGFANNAIEPLISVMLEFPGAFEAALGLFAASVFKRAVPAISQMKASGLEAAQAMEQAAMQQRELLQGNARLRGQLAGKTAQRIAPQITTRLGGLTDILDDFERQGENIAPATSSFIRDLEKQGDASVSQLRNVRNELDKSIAIRQQMVDNAKDLTDAERARKQVVLDDVKQTRQLVDETLSLKQQQVEAEQRATKAAKLGARERAAVRKVEIQQQAAANKQLLATIGDTTRIEGTRAAFAKLGGEVRKTANTGVTAAGRMETAFVQAGAKSRAAFLAMSGSARILFANMQLLMGVFGTLIGAFFILRPLIERIGKGMGVISNLSDDAASALDRASKNTENFAAGMERLDRIGAPDTIGQLSSNFETLANVIKSSNEDLQSLSDIDLSEVNVNALFGRDQGDIKDEIVATFENIGDAAERAGPEALTELSDIFNKLGVESVEDIKNLEAGTKRFTNFVQLSLPFVQQEFIKLSGTIAKVSEDSKQLAEGVAEFGQEISKFIEQLAPSTPLDSLVSTLDKSIEGFKGSERELSKLIETGKRFGEVLGKDFDVFTFQQDIIQGLGQAGNEIDSIAEKLSGIATTDDTFSIKAELDSLIQSSDTAGVIIPQAIREITSEGENFVFTRDNLLRLSETVSAMSGQFNTFAGTLKDPVKAEVLDLFEEVKQFRGELFNLQQDFISNERAADAASNKVKLFGEALGFDSPDLLLDKFKSDLRGVNIQIDLLNTAIDRLGKNDPRVEGFETAKDALNRQRQSLAEQRDLSIQISELEREKANTLDEEKKIRLESQIAQAKLNVALQNEGEALKAATKQLDTQTKLKLEQFRLEQRLQDIQIETERATTSLEAESKVIQSKKEQLSLEKELQKELNSLDAVEEARIDNQSRLLDFRERELDTQNRIAQTISEIASINKELTSSSTSPQETENLKEQRSVLLDNLEILNQESASLEQQKAAIKEILAVTTELSKIQLFKDATASVTEATERLAELTGNEFADTASSAAESFAAAAERAAELKLNEDATLQDRIDALGDVIGHFADATAALEDVDGTFGDIAEALSAIQGGVGLFEQIQSFGSQQGGFSGFLSNLTGGGGAGGFLSALSGGLGIASSAFGLATSLFGAGGPALSEEEIEAIQNERRREERTGALGTNEEEIDSITTSLESIESINFDTFSQGSEMVSELKKLNDKFKDVSTIIASEGVTATLDSFGQQELQELVRSGLEVIAVKNNKKVQSRLADFGDDITEVVSAGIRIMGGTFQDIVSGQLSARLFVDFQEEGGLFDSADFREVEFLDESLVNQEFLNQVSEVILDTADTITEFGEQLGFTQDLLQSRLETFTLGEFTLDLTGDLEKREQELESFFSSTANDLANTIIPGIEQFQEAGEELFETLTRVVQTQLVFEEGLSLIGRSLEDFVNFSEDTIQQAIDNISFEFNDPGIPEGAEILRFQEDLPGVPDGTVVDATGQGRVVNPNITETIQASSQDAIALLAIQWREAVVEALGGPEGEELQEVFRNFAEGVLSDTQLLAAGLSNATENLNRGFRTLIESAGGVESDLFEGFDPTEFNRSSFLEFFRSADFTEFPEAFAEALKIGEVIGTVEKLVTDLFNTLGLDNLVQAQEDAINTLSEGLADTARGEAQRRLDRALSDLGVESFSDVFPAIQEAGGVSELSANQVESLNDATEALGDIARAAADKIVGAIQQARNTITNIDSEIRNIRQSILASGGTVQVAVGGVEHSFTGLSGAARLASMRLEEAQQAFNNAISPFAIVEQGEGLIQNILQNMQAQQSAAQQSTGVQEDFSDEISDVEDRLSDLKSLLEDIRDFLVDIRLDEDISPLTPFEQLQFSQDNFTNALDDLAEQLDLGISFGGIEDLTGSTFQQAIGQLAGNLDELSPDAQENIVDFARQFLDQARSAFGGSAQFQNIFDTVVGSLDELGLSISGEIGNLEDQLSELEQFQQAQQTREQSLAVQQQSLQRLEDARAKIAEAERIIGDLTELAESGLLFDENGNLQSERILQVEGFTKEMFEKTDWGPFKDLQATASTPDVVDLVGGPEGTNAILKDILLELKGQTQPIDGGESTTGGNNGNTAPPPDKGGDTTVPPAPPPGPLSVGEGRSVDSILFESTKTPQFAQSLSREIGSAVSDAFSRPGDASDIAKEIQAEQTKSATNALVKFLITEQGKRAVGSGPFGGTLFTDPANNRFIPEFNNNSNARAAGEPKERPDPPEGPIGPSPGDDDEIGPIFEKLDRTLENLPNMIDKLVTTRLKQRK